MSQPLPGDRILVLKPRWLRLILGGRKTLEIRGSPLAPGPAWLGSRGIIYGSCILGTALEVRSADEWDNLRGRHQVQGTSAYPRPWAIPLHDVRHL